MAEGAGVFVVERLSDARRNGHPVLAVVTGSAVNQDGASNGLTAPNGPSQRRVIAAALTAARVAPADVDVVEAHGIGHAARRPDRGPGGNRQLRAAAARRAPLWLGSVKSNIGHTQGRGRSGRADEDGAGPAAPGAAAGPCTPRSRPRTLDWSAGDAPLLTEPVPGSRRTVPAGRVSAFGISAPTPRHPGRPPAHERTAGCRETDGGCRQLSAADRRCSPPGVGVAGLRPQRDGPLRAQARRLAEWAASHPANGPG